MNTFWKKVNKSELKTGLHFSLRNFWYILQTFPINSKIGIRYRIGQNRTVFCFLKGSHFYHRIVKLSTIYIGLGNKMIHMPE